MATDLHSEAEVVFTQPIEVYGFMVRAKVSTYSETEYEVFGTHAGGEYWEPTLGAKTPFEAVLPYSPEARAHRVECRRRDLENEAAIVAEASDGFTPTRVR